MAKEEGGSLPGDIFYEFAEDGHLTWRDFMEACKNRDITKYVQSSQVIMTYQENTMKAMEVFMSQVVSQNYSAEEADVILTTCHAAKGLEWDNVELCDDFLNLSEKSFAFTAKEKDDLPTLMTSLPSGNESGGSNSLVTFPTTRRKGWQFDINSFGDDLNLVYVACTRAKKTLCLPKSIASLLQEFDVMHHAVAAAKNGGTMPLYNEESMMVVKGSKLKKGQLWELYHDLCMPLRKELGVPDDCKIMKTLFSIDDDDDSEEILKVKSEKIGDDSSDYEC